MLIETELFLKLPAGKPPFFGILYQAQAANFAMANNQDLIKVTGRDLHLRLEIAKDTLNCLLEMNGVNDIRFYSGVKFNRSELSAWVKTARRANVINFGHVIATNDGVKIAKVWQRRELFVLQIQRMIIYAKKKSTVVLIAK